MNIERIYHSDLSEISNLAPLGDYVYYLFQRRFQPEPYQKVNVKTNLVSEAFMPPYPLATWFWSRHSNKIVYVGQAYTEGWLPPDNPNRVVCGGVEPSSVACSVVNDNGVFSFNSILRTDNVNELIGVCYQGGQFKAGERSGELPEYYKKCAAHPDGGGIWVSDDGKSWSWSGFRDPYIDLIGKGRECYLAVLNGNLYAFMHGGQVSDAVPSSIYRVLNNYSTVHIYDTAENNIGLVPFPFNYADEANQFSWKGSVILWNSYPALGVFNPSQSPPLQFWPISVDGVPVNNAGALPVGVHNGKLLIATVVGNNYTICEASEIFGSVTQIASNWMAGGFSPKGIINNNKLWIGVMNVPGSAVDVLSLDGAPPIPPTPPNKYTLTVNLKDPEGNPIPDVKVVVV